MSEPTSVLDFEDLIIEIAYKLGIAYYGANGTEEPQVPVDTHDLIVCKRIVNKAIRMFIHDAPQPNGWKWTRPVASVDLWPTIDLNVANAFSAATFANGVTTLTVPTAAFFATMELKDIVITGVGTFTIQSYVAPTQITVSGDIHTTAVGKTWSITADGDYTLPSTFGGQYTGTLTFVAGTNRGIHLHWVDEGWIRERRSNAGTETGTPFQMAIRIMDSGSPRRRWELMTYRQPSEFFTVLFPYILQFDELVNLTDVQPAPFGHDETIKAACLAVVERDNMDATTGPQLEYYQHCLLNSYRVDAMSAPKTLGYFGNPTASSSAYPPIKDFRDNWYMRPNVSFNS